MTLLRVDVMGVAVYVRTQKEVDLLRSAGMKLAIAKLALHKIIAAFDDDGPFIAGKALEDMKMMEPRA